MPVSGVRSSCDTLPIKADQSDSLLLNLLQGFGHLVEVNGYQSQFIAIGYGDALIIVTVGNALAALGNLVQWF